MSESPHVPSCYLVSLLPRISDDICVIFAALEAGSSCYFISNDHMSDKVSMLSPEQARLFSLWQASRQITMHPNRVQLLVSGRQSCVCIVHFLCGHYSTLQTTAQ